MADLRISASSYDAYRTCPRLYYWQHVVRLKRVRHDGARRFGSLYHAGLEAWWRESDGGFVPWIDRDASLVAALKAVVEAARHIDTDPFEVARAEALVIAYHARYFELDFDTPSLLKKSGSVEIWFDLPLLDERGTTIPGWRLVGKRDSIKRFARDRQSRVVEHKQTSMDIDGASDYWARLKIDVQASIYIDAAQQLGESTVNEAMYDVAKRPALRAYEATPLEARRFTKGKGCKYCGGRAGGAKGVLQGSGRIMVRTKVDGDGLPLPAPVDVETTCTACRGTGWKLDDETGEPEAPRLHDNQHETAETPIDFKMRIAKQIESAPDDYFRMATVSRTNDQLIESRADLVMTTGEIGAMLELARMRADGNVLADASRRCWPRNSSTCTNIYGRRCDYIDVCSGAVLEPTKSTLYQISTRKS